MKRLLCILLSFIFASGLCGCISRPVPEELSNSVSQSTDKPHGPATSFELGQMDFAVQLLQKGVDEPSSENVLLSPLSAMLALSMTANGAAGSTLTQMETMLGGTLSIDALNKQLKDYVDNLPDDKKHRLHIANSIWFKEDESFTVEKDFLDDNSTYYDAEIHEVPFTPKTVKEINKWVNKNTDHMIDNILDEIPKDTLMYLINALAFDAEWDTIYEDTQIRSKDFVNYDHTSTSLEMMSSSEHFYLEDEDAIGFLKNYKNGAYQFAALLPNRDVDVYDYIDSLNSEKLLKMLQNPSHNNVFAVIPKFEYDYSISLNEVLHSMGMTDAFDWQKADLSKLGHYPDRPLYISKVLQKTYISIDEKGTRAGAATSVSAAGATADERPKEVILNRPFVYMIIDGEHKLPVFIGAVVKL